MDSLTLVSLPIFIGSFVLGLNKIANRFIMKSGLISPLQLLIHLFGGTTFAFSVIYLSFWGFTMPQLLQGFWKAVLLGTLANFFIQFLGAKTASIKEGEVSLTAPLSAMTPGLITILAVTLGEYPSRIGIVGIFLMSIGSYVLLFEKSPQYWWEYIGPLKRILLLFKIRKLSQQERGKTLVVILSLSGAAISTFGILFDGLYVRRGVNLQGLTLAMITLLGLLTLSYLIWYLIKPDTKDHRKNGFGFKIYHGQPKYLLVLLCMIGFWLIMMYTFQTTYNHTYMAYVGTLKRISILISVLIGHFWFNEVDIKKRLGASIMIVLGAILISMDDLPVRISTQMQIWGL